MIQAIVGAMTVAAYLYAVRTYGIRYPHRRFGAGRLAAFCSGVAMVVGVLLPPADAWADASFAAHMAQHLILALIVPPLVLLGAPLLLVISLSSPLVGRKVSRIARHPIALFALSPIFAWIAFVSVLWGMHFSSLYALALRSQSAHVFEHLLLLGVSVLFWMPIVQVGYSPYPVPYPARVFYVFLAIPQGAFLGLVIYSSRHVLYAHYLLGRSVTAALADQQNAGAVMWIGGGALLFAALMLTALAWAIREHRETALA